MTERLTSEAALAKLTGLGGKEFVTLFRHGSLEVEIYRPNRVDRQQPHPRDEVYVVLSGSGWFVVEGARQPFEAGEVLFAPAGVEHRGVQNDDSVRPVAVGGNAFAIDVVARGEPVDRADRVVGTHSDDRLADESCAQRKKISGAEQR